MKKGTFMMVSLLFLGSLFFSFHAWADEIDSRIERYDGKLELHYDNTATFTEEVTFVYDDPYNGQ